MPTLESVPQDSDRKSRLAVYIDLGSTFQPLPHCRHNVWFQFLLFLKDEFMEASTYGTVLNHPPTLQEKALVYGDKARVSPSLYITSAVPVWIDMLQAAGSLYLHLYTLH